MRTCILILGMHRSGTSALARIVNLLGAALPKTLLPANATNPAGHWESMPLVQLNDSLLAAAGSAWDDWRAVDPLWMSSEIADSFVEKIAAALEAEFDTAQLFCLKDPRLCRLLPLWARALARLNVHAVALHIVRHPLEVAASLATRDGFPSKKSHLLWLRHVLESELQTRHLRRAFIGYEALLSNWRDPLGAAGRRLGVDWPRQRGPVESEVAAFITADLYRSRIARSDLCREAPEPWIWTTYTACERLLEAADDKEAQANLDEVRARFEEACRAFGGLVAGATKMLAANHDEMAHLQARAVAYEAEAKNSRAEIAALREALAQTQPRPQQPRHSQGAAPPPSMDETRARYDTKIASLEAKIVQMESQRAWAVEQLQRRDSSTRA
jgi:hypothetical protein